MKPQTQNNHNLLFPVNYLKNHQETTTMKEVSGTSQFAQFMLNLPENLRSIFMQSKRTTTHFAGSARHFLVPGGLILSSFSKKAFRAIGLLLAPLFHLLSLLIKGIDAKVSIFTDEFFAFMDGFVMMDYDKLQLAVFNENSYDSAVASNGMSGFKAETTARRSRTFSSIASGRKETHQAAINLNMNEFYNTLTAKTQPGHKKNQLFSKWNDKVHEKFKRMSVPFKGFKLLTPKPIQIPQLKLPFKPLLSKLSTLTNMYRYPFFDRIYAALDPVFMFENPLNQQAYKK